uniref:Subtilisin n=1 Tax=Bicosoecida sp. CB-2014 TaxID=1486930 RepID=A0A7S1CMP0_9STRA
MARAALLGVLAIALVASSSAAAAADAAKAPKAASALRGGRALQASGPPRPLSPGYPVNAQAADGAYAHFYVAGMTDADFPMAISMSPTFGDPDLYVSCGHPRVASDYPTQSSSDWSSDGTGAEKVTVDLGDWTGVGCAADASDSMLISVYGFTNSSFTIEAMIVSGHDPTPLFNDVPVHGNVVVDKYDFYAFDGAAQPVSITVNSIDGDADVYVSCHGSMPSTDSYVWDSANGGNSDDVIHVGTEDPHYCHTGFVIGVYGFSGSTFSDDDDDGTMPTFDDTNPPPPVPADTAVAGGKKAKKAQPTVRGRRMQIVSPSASYVITALQGNTERNLLLNEPVVDFTEYERSAYYSVDTDAVGDKGVKISVAPQSQDADVDLYVNCGSDGGLPSSTNNRWSSMESYWSPDTVVIMPSDDQRCPSPGKYVVAVYGYEPEGGAMFSVVAAPATQDLSWINLPFGSRLGGALSGGARPEYYLLRLGAVTSVDFNFVAGTGSGVTIGVRALHNASDDRTLPTRANAEWKKSVTGFSGSGTPDIGTISVSASDPEMQGAWALAIGVFANDESEEPIYLLEASGNLRELAGRELEAAFADKKKE